MTWHKSGLKGEVKVIATFSLSASALYGALWHARQIHERIIQQKKVNTEIARVHNLSTPHLFEACKRKHSSATLSMYLEINA